MCNTFGSNFLIVKGHTCYFGLVSGVHVEKYKYVEYVTAFIIL